MNETSPPPRLLGALAGSTADRPPVWFMRQAGRFLPEYRAVRETAPDFIAFCLDPEKAAKVTLQPLQRFPFDAAIVFADILLIPMALGQAVCFEAGEGPRLGPLPEPAALSDRIEGVTEHLAPIAETLKRVRASLDMEKALIGFAGAPWTVLTYMLQGRGGERDEARTRAYQAPTLIDQLIDILVDATIRYLAMQVDAGAQVLQIFESWADGLPDDQFERLIVQPHVRIIAGLRDCGVTAPIIGFPRGAGGNIVDYALAVPVQGIGLDTQTPLALGRQLQAAGKTIQGALDPILLRQGGLLLDTRVEAMLEARSAGPYIFNLGHGILPDTPIDHVERVLRRVTSQ